MVQVPDPAIAYVPGAHDDGADDVDPAGHTDPESHGPVQLGDVSPVALPKRPGAHKPLQLALTTPLMLPNVPCGHGRHAPAPLAL